MCADQKKLKAYRLAGVYKPLKPRFYTSFLLFFALTNATSPSPEGPQPLTIKNCQKGWVFANPNPPQVVLVQPFFNFAPPQEGMVS